MSLKFSIVPRPSYEPLVTPKLWVATVKTLKSQKAIAITTTQNRYSMANAFRARLRADKKLASRCRCGFSNLSGKDGKPFVVYLERVKNDKR